MATIYGKFAIADFSLGIYFYLDAFYNRIKVNCATSPRVKRGAEIGLSCFCYFFLSEKGAYPVIHMSGMTTDAVGDVECSHPRTRNSTKL